MRDAAACPAGESYLSWPDFAALGAARLAASPDAVASRIAAIRPADPATLLYTSGTTGNPKGVVITHASVLYELVTATVSGNARPHVRWVSYLPLAHIAERMFTLYLAIYNAGHTYFCHNAATELVASIGEVKPTAFFGVPRVWEKIQAGIQALLAAEQDEGTAGRRGGGHGHRPAVRAELPVRPAAPRRAGRRVRRGRRRPCCGRSGPCSGWATPRSWSARRRRCRPTSATSSPGSA